LISDHIAALTPLYATSDGVAGAGAGAALGATAFELLLDVTSSSVAATASGTTAPPPPHAVERDEMKMIEAIEGKD
jgi:hypothetical protein